MTDISFNIACKELKIAQIAQLNQLFQLLHLVHIYGHGFYELSRMLMRKNVNNEVGKDSPITPIAALETSRKLGRANTRKDFWDCYQGWPVAIASSWFARPQLRSRKQERAGHISATAVIFSLLKWHEFAYRLIRPSSIFFNSYFNVLINYS